MLPSPTEEQRDILRALVPGQHITVNAVAGSGKTTTNLLIAQTYPDRQVLLLTYNNHLRRETKDRASNIDNINVHTFHSWAGVLFDKVCFNDTQMASGLDMKDEDVEGEDAVSPIDDCSEFDDAEEEIVVFKKTCNNSSKYDIIIIDEAQDMTPLLYRFCNHVINKCTNDNFNVLVLGDYKQNIYKYAGADYRFMKYFNNVLATDSGSIPIELPLKSTWRLTDKMTAFINNVALGGQEVLVSPDARIKNFMPRYIIDSWPNERSMVFTIITELLRSKRYEPSDIFILAPSATAKNITKISKTGKSIMGKVSPAVCLANCLSDAGYMIHMKMEGGDGASIECLESKIIISSFHQAKGRERKVCFVLGFDNSYYEYYNRDASREVCPNELYVAMTRAKERLYLVQASNKEPLPFINASLISKYAKVFGEMGEIKMPDEVSLVKSVTDFIRSIPSDMQDYIIERSGFIKRERLGFLMDCIKLPCEATQSCKGKKIKEPVSDINGIATVATVEYITCGYASIFVDPMRKKLFAKTFLRESNFNKADIRYSCSNIVEEVLRASLIDVVCSSKSLFRLKQISSFTWLSNKALMTAYARLSSTVVCDQFEVSDDIYDLGSKNTCGFADKVIKGRYDIITGYRLYEIKSVACLSNEHFIQTALYALMRSRCTLEDAKQAAIIAINNIKERRKKFNMRDEYHVGDPVKEKKSTKDIYKFVYEITEKRIKLIDAHGIVTSHKPDNISPDMDYFADKISMLQSDIERNELQTYLYNVRNGELYELTITDIKKLRELFAADNSFNVSDSEFVKKMKTINRCN